MDKSNTINADKLTSELEAWKQNILDACKPRNLEDLSLFRMPVSILIPDGQRKLGKVMIELLRMGNEVHPFMDCSKGIVAYVDNEFCGCFLYDGTFVLGGYYRQDHSLSVITEKMDITDKLIQVCKEHNSEIVIQRFDFNEQETGNAI